MKKLFVGILLCVFFLGACTSNLGGQAAKPLKYTNANDCTADDTCSANKMAVGGDIAIAPLHVYGAAVVRDGLGVGELTVNDVARVRGRLGVGTDIPLADLHVVGSAVVQNNLGVGGITAGGDITAGGQICDSNGCIGQGSGSSVATSCNGDSVCEINAANVSGWLQTRSLIVNDATVGGLNSYGDVAVYNNNLNVIDGRIAIGTVNPLKNLHIESSNNEALIYARTSAPNQTAGLVMDAATNDFQAGIVKAGSQAGFLPGDVLVVNNDGGITLMSRLSTDGATSIRLLNNGYVGIGTLNPRYKLEVDGTVKSKSTFSDYVYASSLHVTGNATISGLSGNGNAYACIDRYGNLYRSQSPCV